MSNLTQYDAIAGGTAMISGVGFNLLDRHIPAPTLSPLAMSVLYTFFFRGGNANVMSFHNGIRMASYSTLGWQLARNFIR